VNGTIAGDAYGPAAAVQAVETGFGDNSNELNAAYCTFGGGRYYLALTGNLESNFNKLEIFIDSKPGGEHVLSGMPGNDGAFRMAGMTFDGGFQADYHIIVRRGFSGAPRFDLDFAQLGTGMFSSYGDVFGGSLDGAAATGTGLNTQPILVAFNNSNAAGVLGGNGPADQMAAAAVQTGLELGIALTDLNFGGGPIKVCAFINGSNHDYASNQFLGPLMPPQGNLGSDGTGVFTGVLSFNLGSFPNDQFCTCRDQPVPVQPTTGSRLKANYR
jgi:hypothetical protein